MHTSDLCRVVLAFSLFGLLAVAVTTLGQDGVFVCGLLGVISAHLGCGEPYACILLAAVMATLAHVGTIFYIAITGWRPHRRA